MWTWHNYILFHCNHIAENIFGMAVSLRGWLGLILGLRPGNERRRYLVTTSLIGCGAVLESALGDDTGAYQLNKLRERSSAAHWLLRCQTGQNSAFTGMIIRIRVIGSMLILKFRGPFY